ncbi:putative methylated-DNA:protein-cysteine methyltransferase [Flavimobilis marinus]|uniref:Methylated-DNA-[protein]-cysteine S-methyltransferase n=1 Tax=Flavimobilis marinus TaxID=285351 RepID=A0A1I2CB75_9MICO|nr:methylated-DNA--[protein]-cysteine S-methyltransferase [Flavimobilis marinus]GHG48174.1 putative methylated-DNA:protein-cysteine methyltransferase [Flavimobilis marinus]SFE64930.1 methylated-DNA-[protein]-cysteine S-methyltransferase [Flavimobilis marinus]
MSAGPTTTTPSTAAGPTTARFATLPTPDGPFTVLAGADAVLASGWTGDVAGLLALVHPLLRPAEVAAARVGEAGVLGSAVEAVTAYYAGDLAAPARVPVRQTSGEFRVHAWDVLREVGPGERVTYTEYAARAGRPAAVRAAAAACAMNAAALFVPCHRVLGADGGLRGFRYGTAIKRSLLDRETPPAPGTTLF